MPVYALKLIALGQEDGPENIEDAFLLPAHERTVDCGSVAELKWQMVPLAARPQPKDDAVEATAGISAGTAQAIGWIIAG